LPEIVAVWYSPIWMRTRIHPRAIAQAWLGTAALLLQLALPVLHQQHAERSASGPTAPQQSVAHDALACGLCAAIAHGSVTVPALAPTLQAASPAAADLLAPVVRLFAAPVRPGATPRGPPALA
jgi:hypothetical protein